MNFKVKNKEVLFSVCKSMKQLTNLKVDSIIIGVYDKVTKTMEVDFVSDPIMGVLSILGNGYILEYNGLVAFLRSYISYKKSLKVGS